MRITLLIGMAMLWLIGTLISLTLENSYLGQEPQYEEQIIDGETVLVRVGSVSTLEKLMSPEFSEMTNPISFVVGVFNIVWDYLGIIWNMLWWNYSFFTGVWSIFRYVGWCISLGVVISLVLAIRGTSSG
jgi:hypothetical protein